MTDRTSAAHGCSTPRYLADLEARSVDELRAMHAECLELETEVSYVRRLTQARIDILEAEIERRASGGSLEDLIHAAPQILADPGPRGNPASSRLPLQMAPEQDSEWAPDLERVRRPARQPARRSPTTSSSTPSTACGRSSARCPTSAARCSRVIDRIDLSPRRAAALTSPRPMRRRASPARADRIDGAMQRVAMLSVHTSPLAQPGTGDGGGMNVYVRALGVGAGARRRRGRRAHPRRAPRATAGRRGRARASGCCTSTAGPCAPVPQHELPELVGDVHRRRAPRCSSGAAPTTTCCTRTTGCRARSGTG